MRLLEFGDTERGYKTKDKFGEWKWDAKSELGYLSKSLLAVMLFGYDYMFKASIIESGSILGLGVDRLPLKPYYLPSNKLSRVLSLINDTGSIGITDLEDKNLFDISINDCVKDNDFALKSASKPSNTHSFVAKDVNIQY